MSTNYPATIDTTNNLPTVIDNFTPNRGSVVNNLRDTILALERALGINPAGNYGTVGARLSNTENILNNLQIITLTNDLGGSLTLPLVIGLQGNPISTVSPDVGQFLGWNGLAWTPLFAQIGAGYAITISTASQLVEVGQAVTNPIFNATYSETPVTAIVQDDQGNPPQNVFTANPPSLPPNIFVYSQSYEFDSYPAQPYSVNFTLTSSDGKVTATNSTAITWTQRIYYGLGAPGGNTAAFIQGLSNNPLTISRVTSFDINAGTNQAIYFAYRTAYGPATFWVEGFEGGFNLISNSISVTNAHGFIENYTLYQSSQVNLGPTTINVF